MSMFANQPIDGMPGKVSRALAWWLGELQAAYHDVTRRVGAVAGNPLTIEAGEDRWVLRRRQGRLGEIDWQRQDRAAARQLLRELAGAGGRTGAVAVEIPPERILSKTLDLPAAAKGDLDRILSFEIVRHFPFPAERVFYRYRIVERTEPPHDAAAPLVSVEVAALPRDIVRAILDELAAAGLRASRIALVPAPRAAPLFLAADALARPGTPPPASRRLAAAVAGLAVLAAVSWPMAQQVRRAAIEREIAALKPRAEAALRAREAARREAAQTDTIARLRAGRPPLIAVLAALSRDVPDGSWLNSLSISGSEIVLDGLSSSAANIALQLGHDANFAGVAFRSPIARDAATGHEHFQLGVTIAGKRR